MKYKVPFVDYPKQYHNIQQDIDDAYSKVMEGGDFILREDLEQFEMNMSHYLGVQHCIGLNSGTDALYFALLASGIKEGDEVITVAHTFSATIGAIVHCNAKPILVDIADDYNIDVYQIEQAITERTNAIIPVHLNGRVSRMGKIMELAGKYNLAVIEDACQSLGATYCGIKSGTIGDIGCFSFYPAKILGCYGDGGMLVTRNDKVAEIVRWLRDNGREKGNKEVRGFGYNSRLDNLQAAFLDAKLQYLDNWIEKRRIIAVKYSNQLAHVGDLIKPHSPISGSDFYDVFQNYVIRTKHRNKLVEFLKQNEIETLISWEIPTHKQPALKLDCNLPITEQFSKEVVSLPMYPELDDWQIEYVIDKIKEFYAS